MAEIANHWEEGKKCATHAFRTNWHSLTLCRTARRSTRSTALGSSTAAGTKATPWSKTWHGLPLRSRCVYENSWQFAIFLFYHFFFCNRYTKYFIRHSRSRKWSWCVRSRIWRRNCWTEMASRHLPTWKRTSRTWSRNINRSNMAPTTAERWAEYTWRVRLTCYVVLQYRTSRWLCRKVHNR